MLKDRTKFMGYESFPIVGIVKMCQQAQEGGTTLVNDSARAKAIPTGSDGH